MMTGTKEMSTLKILNLNKNVLKCKHDFLPCEAQKLLLFALNQSYKQGIGEAKDLATLAHFCLSETEVVLIKND